MNKEKKRKKEERTKRIMEVQAARVAANRRFAELAKSRQAEIIVGEINKGEISASIEIIRKTLAKRTFDQ